jgi:hypothetical protein
MAEASETGTTALEGQERNNVPHVIAFARHEPFISHT